ncbi:MAG TPA: ankyrin repeat domain-containing protein [Candidatus Babeliales bacterium]|nr:ankyrin repeat domain-containing protein [Candidatus Babeliales bacterium]
MSIKNHLLIGVFVNIIVGLQVCAAGVDQKENKRQRVLVGQVQLRQRRDQMQKKRLAPNEVAATANFVDRYAEEIKLDYFPSLRKHRSMIKKMVENEELYKESHIVCYHAQNSENRLIPAILNYCYESPYPNFEYLRTRASDYSNVQQYLDSFAGPHAFRAGKGATNDNLAHIRKDLLAVNPTLFSNFHISGESTWDYFLRNRSIGSFVKEWLKEERTYGKDILDVNKEFPSETGDIIQIFIPKHLVDECVYVSRPFGVPQKEYMVNDNNEIVAADDYDVRRQRYIKASTLLELLQKEKNPFKHINEMQLRLFFSRTGPLMNPKMGVKMFRFTSLTSQQLQGYEKRVKEVLNAHFRVPHTSNETYFFDCAPEKPALQSNNQVARAIEQLTVPKTIFEHVYMPNAIEEIKKMLQAGGDLNCKDGRGRTLLMHAASQKNLDVVRFLLQEKADVQSASQDGSTVLMKAAAFADRDIVELILNAGADKDAQNSKGVIALTAAIASRKTDTVQLLLEHQVNVNSVDKSGRTPLMIAIETTGNAEIADILVKAGASMDVTDNDGQTLLIRAAQYGNVAALKWLIDMNVNKNDQDKSGMTALMWAAANGHTGVATALLRAGADANAGDKEGQTALMCAAGNGHAEVTKLLISYGVDIQSADKSKWTALIYAANYGHEEDVDVLLAAGADKNAQCIHGGTALVYATRSKHLGIVRCLLAKGAHFDVFDKHGLLVSQAAVESGSTSVMNFFIRMGANEEDRRIIRVRMVLQAADIGRPEVIKSIVESGRHKYVWKDPDVDLALICAAHDGMLHLVKVLIEVGANINAQHPVTGMTPMIAAATANHLEVSRFLWEQPALNKMLADKNGKTAETYIQEKNEQRVKQALDCLNEI